MTPSSNSTSYQSLYLPRCPQIRMHPCMCLCAGRHPPPKNKKTQQTRAERVPEDCRLEIESGALQYIGCRLCSAECFIDTEGCENESWQAAGSRNSLTSE